MSKKKPGVIPGRSTSHVRVRVVGYAVQQRLVADDGKTLRSLQAQPFEVQDLSGAPAEAESRRAAIEKAINSMPKKEG
jgi:hypothetical protein